MLCIIAVEIVVCVAVVVIEPLDELMTQIDILELSEDIVIKLLQVKGENLVLLFPYFIEVDFSIRPIVFERIAHVSVVVII